MNESTWEDGPWIVEVKVVYEIEGCGPDDASFWARHMTLPEMDPGMRSLPEIEMRRITAMVTPSALEPLEMDRLEEG